MFPIISTWSILGTVFLIYLTYQDYKNNMLVDDRKNYFMMGLTSSFLSFVGRGFFYIVAMIVLIILFNYYSKKYKLVGEADINSMNWLFFGYGYLNPIFLLIYLGILLIFSILYMFFKSKVYKVKQAVPYYAIILLSFILMNCLFGLYTK